MPYLACPNCDLIVYSAAKVSTVDDCPRCGTILGRTGSIFRSPLPSDRPSRADLAASASPPEPPASGHGPRPAG